MSSSRTPAPAPAPASPSTSTSTSAFSPIEAITEALLASLRARDPYTFGHCLRVGTYCRLLAHAAGLTEVEQQTVEFAGIFHDLGKIAIPDSILLKPGRLSQVEEAIMRAHPIKSVEILAPLRGIPLFEAVLPGIRHHHERIDGAGYPEGVLGERIPLAARIILIADTYDAMTTTRVYRKALPRETAFKELKLFSGRQFDRHLVDIFAEAHPRWESVEQTIAEEIRSAEITARFRKKAA